MATGPPAQVSPQSQGPAPCELQSSVTHPGLFARRPAHDAPGAAEAGWKGELPWVLWSRAQL